MNKKYPSLHMLKDMFKRVKKARLSAERGVEVIAAVQEHSPRLELIDDLEERLLGLRVCGRVSPYRGSEAVR